MSPDLLYLLFALACALLGWRLKGWHVGLPDEVLSAARDAHKAGCAKRGKKVLRDLAEHDAPDSKPAAPSQK